MACRFVDDVFEIEFWFETVLLAPNRLPQLHAEGKIKYEWTGEHITNPNYVLSGTDDLDRIGKVRFTKTLTMSDNLVAMQFPTTVKATDTRFTSLDVSDSDTEVTDWIMPCVEEGNAPAFSVLDTTIVEGDSGNVEVSVVIEASEAVTGRSITVDFCSADLTAKSFSTEAGVKHAAYDVNGVPFVSYIEYQNVRAVFDASFPKFYNTRLDTPTYSQARQLLANALSWLDHSGRPKKVLLVGDLVGTVDYSVKYTGGSGFSTALPDNIRSNGYTCDVLYHNELAGGFPDASSFAQYAVVIFISSDYLPIDSGALSSAWVYGCTQAVRSGMGLMIVTDHTVAPNSFASSGNQLANELYANISGNVNRSAGTDFDQVRQDYGDHPLISGITGHMPGDVSEGLVDTTPPTVDDPADYDTKCGTVTFNKGDTSQTIKFTVFGDTKTEGDEDFKVTISNPERGSIAKAEGTVTIIGDDVVPCGAGASAGGDGVIWADQSVGSSVGCAVILWDSKSVHDRFDVFRNGQYVQGSNKDIDDYLSGQGNVHANLPSPYDYDTWKSGGSYPAADPSLVKHLPNRAGAGVLFVPHYPDKGHPSVYQIRAEGGGSSTGWDMSTYCDHQAKSPNPGGAIGNFDNRLFQRPGQIDILDMHLDFPSGGTNNYNYRVSYSAMSGNWPDGDLFVGGGVSLTNADDSQSVRSKIQLWNNNTMIGETAYISNGTFVTIDFNFNKDTDYRYIEVRVIHEVETATGYMSYSVDGASGQHRPLRVSWQYTITRL